MQSPQALPLPTISWIGQAAASGAVDGKIVDSELAEVLIEGGSLSVRRLKRQELSCVNYTMFFFRSYEMIKNILAPAGRPSSIS